MDNTVNPIRRFLHNLFGPGPTGRGSKIRETGLPPSTETTRLGGNNPASKVLSNEPVQDPLKMISSNEFYETPFKLRGLVPSLQDVKMTMTSTTEENMDAITYAMRAKQPIYLRGATGVGKTNLVLLRAATTGIQLHEIGGEESMDETNIIGRILPALAANREAPVPQVDFAKILTKEVVNLMADKGLISRDQTLKLTPQILETVIEKITDNVAGKVIGTKRQLEGGGFEWVDGKAVKAIKPVVQVPLPVLEKPAKADLLPQGTSLKILEGKEIDGKSWVKVKDETGKSGWVLSQSVSSYKIPNRKIALRKTPEGEKDFMLEPGMLLGTLDEREENGTRWLLVKTPVKDPREPLLTHWLQGWIKAANVHSAVAAKFGTQLFEEPQKIKHLLDPGVALYWQERLDDTKGGNITWSRVQLPDQFNMAGEEGYVPDCAPRPGYPLLEHNFIRAGILLFDECNLILPGVKKRLNSLLDRRRMLVVDENRNEMIRMHPTAFIFATGNPVSYSDREQESADFLRRFHVVHAKDYTAEDYSAILEDLTRGVDAESKMDDFTTGSVIQFHMHIIKNARNGNIGKLTGPYEYGTRDLIKLAQHVMKQMPKVNHILTQETDVYGYDITDQGWVPVADQSIANLKSGEGVQIIAFDHAQAENADWTKIRFRDGQIGYVKGKLEGESLYQLIWKEARKVYGARIADEMEKEGQLEQGLVDFFGLHNKPAPEGMPVIGEQENGMYRFDDIDMPINPPGLKNVPDKESAALIVNEKTPDAAKRVVAIAQQIYYGDDSMLVGPTASGKTTYVANACMRIGRNLSYFNASDATDKTRFIGKLVQKRGGGQFDFEWQNGLFTEAIVPKAIRPTELFQEPGTNAVEKVPQNTMLYYLKQQKTVDGVKYSLVQKQEDWQMDREQAGKNALWVKDDDIQSDVILIDEGNAARSGSLEGANSLFDKKRRFLLLEDFDGRKVYAHPSCVIFYTANPPEYAGLRYTGVNKISPAARNRFTEIWWPEISPMPTAVDADDASLQERRKVEDAELAEYSRQWLQGLPNRDQLTDWAVKFYREIRNKAALREIGAKREDGEPIIYTITSLQNLCHKVKIFAPDPIELRKYIAGEVTEKQEEELETLINGALQNGSSREEIDELQEQWANKKIDEYLSTFTPEERLSLGAKAAFLSQAYHEFADDFEDEDDRKLVRQLARDIAGENAQNTEQSAGTEGAQEEHAA